MYLFQVLSWLAISINIVHANQFGNDVVHTNQMCDIGKSCKPEDAEICWERIRMEGKKICVVDRDDGTIFCKKKGCVVRGFMDLGAMEIQATPWYVILLICM
jgi:hypothetical protein